ncbi:MAG: hypothetical protein AAFR42_20905 [Cyanobacteria bacterium J06628_6]
MLRSKDGIEFLIELVERGNQADCEGAIAALDINRSVPDIWQQVQQAAQLRGDGLQLAP